MCPVGYQLRAAPSGDVYASLLLLPLIRSAPPRRESSSSKSNNDSTQPCPTAPPATFLTSPCIVMTTSTPTTTADSPATQQSWQSQSLRSVCECHSCQQGITRELHSHGSHDQSLYSSINVSDTPLQIVGGTTKCARVFVWLLQHATAHPAMQQLLKSLASTCYNSCVELGAGTGLISMALALYNGNVIATDQQPSMEMLEHNLEQNRSAIQHQLQTSHSSTEQTSVKLQAQPLLWADTDMIEHILQVAHPTHANKSYAPLRCIVGSDLIYAKENISALVQTYYALATPYLTDCYLVYIPRFEWEQQFFTEMHQQHFASEMVYELDEIQVWRFVKVLRAEASACQAILECAAVDLSQLTDDDDETGPATSQLSYQLHMPQPADATNIQRFSGHAYILSNEPLTTLLLHNNLEAEADQIGTIGKLFFGNFSNYITQSSAGHVPLCFQISEHQEVVAALIAHPYRGPPPANFEFPPQLAVLNQYILPLLRSSSAAAPTDGQTIRIAAVAVSPSYQQRGLATLLIRTLMQCIVQHNISAKGRADGNKEQLIKTVLIETTSDRLQAVCASLGFATRTEVSYSAEHLQLLKNSEQHGWRHVSSASTTRLMIANVLHM